MGSPPYWFPAKRYGWGWGLPTVWQGRLVFIAFFVLVALAVYAFPPARNLASLSCLDRLPGDRAPGDLLREGRAASLALGQVKGR